MGDKQGHPFRGNQWTQTRGGHAASPTAVLRDDFRKRAVIGQPEVIASDAFSNRYSFKDTIWRGVSTPDAIEGAHRGETGDGDFGKGLYFGALGHAQSYGRGGGVMRAAIRPGFKVREIPDSISGRDATERWAERNKVDVVTTGDYTIVRNADALVIDKRAYTLDETVVFDYASHGYRLPEQYAGLSVPLDGVQDVLKDW